jgi:hypothetical protein
MNNDNQKQQDWNKGESEKGNQQGSHSGAATERAQEKDATPASGAYKNETGDPGRTPGSAEGVENFGKTGNE